MVSEGRQRRDATAERRYARASGTARPGRFDPSSRVSDPPGNTKGGADWPCGQPGGDWGGGQTSRPGEFTVGPIWTVKGGGQILQRSTRRVSRGGGELFKIEQFPKRKREVTHGRQWGGEQAAVETFSAYRTTSRGSGEVVGECPLPSEEPWAGHGLCSGSWAAGSWRQGRRRRGMFLEKRREWAERSWNPICDMVKNRPQNLETLSRTGKQWYRIFIPKIGLKRTTRLQADFDVPLRGCFSHPKQKKAEQKYQNAMP